ncbi:hypothetical protein CsatB_030581 [Cannabis sativa]
MDLGSLSVGVAIAQEDDDDVAIAQEDWMMFLCSQENRTRGRHLDGSGKLECWAVVGEEEEDEDEDDGGCSLVCTSGSQKTMRKKTMTMCLLIV